MKHILLILFLLSSHLSYSQNSYLGTWEFEKLSPEVETDSIGKKIALQLFQGYKMEFDKQNYRLTEMGREKVGSWKELGEGVIEINSAAGFKIQKELNFISTNQIILSIKGKEFAQFKKTAASCSPINIPKPIAVGVTFQRERLLGKWNMVKIEKANGNDIGLSPIHKENESVSWEFKANGDFINKSLLEMIIHAKWEMGDDKKSITIISDKYEETKIVRKLSNNELILYLPNTKQTFFFKRIND